MPSADERRASRCRGYTYSESYTEIEVLIPIPTGTKRSQLSITLHDEASGANLWRAEIETAGGEERHVPQARLSVRPAFWPEPLLDGILRGPVDARDSLYQLTASNGGDAWDCVQVSLRKAPQAEGWWGGVVEGDSTVDDGSDSHMNASFHDEDAARLVQRMSTSMDSAAVLCQCAQICVRLADAGRSNELIVTKALAQLAMVMRAHSTVPELQAAGCAVLARAPVTSDDASASIDTVYDSQLLAAVMSAILRHPANTLIQLHGARALLHVSGGEARMRNALLAAEGAALLATMLQQPAPACDAACEALRRLMRSGPKASAALINQGVASTLITTGKLCKALLTCTVLVCLL